jgi:hypothetical protein
MNHTQKNCLIGVALTLAFSILLVTVPQTVSSAPIPPLSVLEPYFMPAADVYGINGWDVGQPSAIHWKTPGIIMEQDDHFYFGFHRFGQVNGWNVKAYGPRAGVESVQLLGKTPQAFPNREMKVQLAQHHIAYTVKACNMSGSLLRITPPTKRSMLLFYSPASLTLFTFDEIPKPEALKALGIAPLQTNHCQ